MLVEQDSETCVKVAEHPKIDALFGILLPYTRIFISYNQYSGMLRHLKLIGFWFPFGSPNVFPPCIVLWSKALLLLHLTAI